MFICEFRTFLQGEVFDVEVGQAAWFAEPWSVKTRNVVANFYLVVFVRRLRTDLH